MCPPQNRRKHNQHFKLLFFTKNLQSVTSNQKSTCWKLNLPLIIIIYLIALLLEMQRKFKQTKVQVFYFVWKETTHKSLKLAAWKSLFSGVYIIGKTCFDKYFLFDVIAGRNNIHKSLSLLWNFFNRYHCTENEVYY